MEFVFEISCILTVYILDRAQKIGHLKMCFLVLSKLKDINSNLQHLQINFVIITWIKKS